MVMSYAEGSRSGDSFGVLTAPRSGAVDPEAADRVTVGPTRVNGQTPCVAWLTGPSSADKAAIAKLVDRHLIALGRRTALLDDSNDGSDLGSDETSRSGSARRVGEVAKLMHDAGLVVIAALNSPYKTDRAWVASLLPPGRFIEVFVDASTETGDPYEPPTAPALWLRTDRLSTEAAAAHIIQAVIGREWRAPD